MNVTFGLRGCGEDTRGDSGAVLVLLITADKWNIYVSQSKSDPLLNATSPPETTGSEAQIFQLADAAFSHFSAWRKRAVLSVRQFDPERKFHRFRLPDGL